MKQPDEQWKATATLFYLRHDNRRNCSLITSCKECDAYEKAANDD